MAGNLFWEEIKGLWFLEEDGLEVETGDVEVTLIDLEVVLI